METLWSIGAILLASFLVPLAFNLFADAWKVLTTPWGKADGQSKTSKMINGFFELLGTLFLSAICLIVGLANLAFCAWILYAAFG